MNEFIKCLNKIKIPVTITQIEMNTYTSDKLLRTIPTSKQLENGEVKILYNDGKYSTISTIESEYKKDTSFKVEYECELM